MRVGVMIAMAGALWAQLASAQPAPSDAPAPPAAAAMAPAPALAATAPLPAPAGDAAIAAFADGYMQTAVDALGLPGATITVLRDGRPILARAYGLADRATGRRVDHATTLFRQASVSKLFIHVLAFQEIEAGRLDLDADINRYLDFRIDGMGGRPITLRHLLTHSAGFEERMNGVFWHDPALPRDQRLAASIPPRVRPPGDMIAYSNYGASLVAAIVERTAGAPFETLVARRILAPLGMTRSSFAQKLPADMRANLAEGYRAGSDTPIPFEVIDPAAPGGLSATSADMAKFLRALSTGGAPLLRPGTLAQMTALAKPLGPGLGSGMALGPIVQSHRGVAVVGHGGNLSATATDLAWMPSTGLAWHVAVAGQGADGAANKLRDGLRRALVERHAAAAPLPRPAAAGVSTAADVAGQYWSTRRAYRNWLMGADILEPQVFATGKDGALLQPSASAATGGPRRWLPTARDRFVNPDTGHELAVMRDGAGRVIRLGLTNAPVSQLDRAPGWAKHLPNVLLAAVAVIVLAVVSGPIGWVARRLLCAPRRDPVPPGRLGARAAAVILAAALLSWASFLFEASESVDLSIFSPYENPAIMPLRILWATGVGAALALAWYAARRWVRAEGSLAGRLSATVTAAAALVIAWAFLRFHQLAPGANF